MLEELAKLEYEHWQTLKRLMELEKKIAELVSSMEDESWN